MSTRTIWRVDLPVLTTWRPDQLALGLSRHLSVTGLIGVTMQIDERRRGYVALEGCAGCAHGRCLPGCLVEALRRTLRAACGLEAGLGLVRSGLSARPYTRAARLRPTPAAAPIPAAALRPWPEARLDLVWSPAPLRTGALVTATLRVGADGPDPATTPLAEGWEAQAARLRRPAPATPALPLLPGGRPFPGEPFLALPVVPAPVAEVAA